MISYKFKYIGGFLLLSGLALVFVNQIHRIKIKIPVLALYSSYIQTRFFTVITTNVFEEITLLCFLAGFLIYALSKEKVELEAYQDLRERSWRDAVLFNSAMLVFSIIFIYGRGFAAILILNIFTTFIFYIVVFQIKKAKLKTGGDQNSNRP